MIPAIAREDVSSVAQQDGVSGVVLAPVPPGEVLEQEFMVPLGLSARALARDLDVPANRITAILHGTRAITADTALRLAARFGTSAEFWMGLQTAFDLEVARRLADHGRGAGEAAEKRG